MGEMEVPATRTELKTAPGRSIRAARGCSPARWEGAAAFAIAHHPGPHPDSDTDARHFAVYGHPARMDAAAEDADLRSFQSTHLRGLFCRVSGSFTLRA